MHNTTPSGRLCFVFGTRPEIIKIAPLIKECQRRDVPFFTIHTGQHYSENMDTVFFRNLYLPRPDYNLSVGSGTHAVQTASMLVNIEKVLLEEKPSIVIVQGDTNSVLAGALVASKLNIQVAHIEAGLRSGDMRMPEEINRKITGVVTNFHFVPTADAHENLVREGVNPSTIYLVGNTVVDAVTQNVNIAREKSTILEQLEIVDKDYILHTIHRPENTDHRDKLEVIVHTLKEIVERYDIRIIWPIHPRTKKQLQVFDLLGPIPLTPYIKMIDPVDYLDMLTLEAGSRTVITDSGGLQEEACILGVPCITVRNNTERPESVAVGANILAGCNKKKILEAVEKNLMDVKRVWENPFGDGRSAEKIIQVIADNIN